MTRWPAYHDWLTPDWQPHPAVKSCVTTRAGHVSAAPYQGFNLGLNCDDQAAQVQANRVHVDQVLKQPEPVCWLDQVHGVHIVRHSRAICQADGVWSDRAGTPCAVLTADCLPVLIARQDGTAVGAFHAGWRGLVSGILDHAVTVMAPAAEPLSAWIGPSIGACCYQVDAPVRQAFIENVRQFLAKKSMPATYLDTMLAQGFREDLNSPAHWRMDLPQLARRLLSVSGVEDVTLSGICTACSSDRFYSYRKSHPTGRFASLIWLQADANL